MSNYFDLLFTTHCYSCSKTDRLAVRNHKQLHEDVHCRDSVAYSIDDGGDVDANDDEDHGTETEENVLINVAESFQPHLTAGTIQPS